MNRRFLTFAAAALVLGLASGATAADPPTRPNIVLLFTDDKC